MTYLSNSNVALAFDVQQFLLDLVGIDMLESACNTTVQVVNTWQVSIEWSLSIKTFEIDNSSELYRRGSWTRTFATHVLGLLDVEQAHRQESHRARQQKLQQLPFRPK